MICGIPQGSQLFNIYVNDIVHASNKFKFMLYADNTNISNLSKKVHSIEISVNWIQLILVV